MAIARPPFTLGLNLPWIDYGWDFGQAAGASMPPCGVHTPATAARVAAAFSRLRAAGVRHVRWFLLCDARAGVRFDRDGLPLAIDSFVAADVAAALALADAHDVRVLFSLLNYQFSLRDPDPSSPVRRFGHGDVLASHDGREALAERVLFPLVDLLGSSPHRSRVMAVEYMNEPELLTPSFRHAHPDERLDEAHVVAFDDLRRLAARVQRRTHDWDLPFTVGSVSCEAARQWMKVLDADARDVLQVHHYGALDELPATLAADAGRLPVWVGEFPAHGIGGEPLDVSLRALGARGIRGAFGWSLLKEEPAIPAADLRAYADVPFDSWLR